jgi:hypothetical protein
MATASYSPYTYDSEDRMAAIVFVFHTRNKPDDTLLIRPDSHSLGFNATFTQHSVGSQVVHHVPNTDLIPYIDRVFTRLSFDEQRPDFVQIDCPGYSSVILKTYRVQSYLSILTEQIQSLQNRWPREVLGKRKTPSVSTQTETTQANSNPWFSWNTEPVAAPAPVAPAHAPAQPPTLRVTRSSARRA